MKVTERDELLIRLDENVKGMVKIQVEQSKHLAMINGSLQRHDENIIGLNTTVYGKKSDKGLCGEMIAIKKVLWSIMAVVLAAGTVGGLEVGDVINWFGG